jgi:uncharacterized protein YukE
MSVAIEVEDTQDDEQVPPPPAMAAESVELEKLMASIFPWTSAEEFEEHSVSLRSKDYSQGQGTFYLDPSELANSQHKLSTLPRPTLLHLWRCCGDFLPQAYHFPKVECHGQNRKINASMFSNRPWVSYSKKNNALYCRDCLLFPSHIQNTEHIARFISVGIGSKNFHKLYDLLRDHEKSGFHTRAVLSREAALSNETNPNFSIEGQILARHTAEVLRNRSRLTSVAKLVIYHGKQGLPLRGHSNETWDDIANKAEPPTNPGNFCSLIHFLVHDFSVEDHQNLISSFTGTKDRDFSTYHSPESQNELLEGCGILVRTRLRKQIDNADCFSILCDEAQDVNMKSQLAFCVRFVDETFTIREEFLSFIPLLVQTGMHISKNILLHAAQFGLDMGKCIGQGYDGCGSMAGKEQGVAARITALYPAAKYFHCASHKLSLCVSSACKNSPVPAIQDALNALDGVWLYFKPSGKRMSLLTARMRSYTENCLQQASVPTKQGQLKGFSPTRWIERIDCIKEFTYFYNVIVTTLGDIANGSVSLHEKLSAVEQERRELLGVMEGAASSAFDSTSSQLPHAVDESEPTLVVDFDDKKSTESASAYFTKIRSVVFLYAIFVVYDILSLLRPLTVSLQGIAKDVLCAYEDIECIKNTFDHVRANAGTNHERIFAEVESMAKLTGLPEDAFAKPRNCAHTSLSDWLRVEVFIPFLDNVIQQFVERFSATQTSLVSLMAVIPAIYCERRRAGLYPNLDNLLDKLLSNIRDHIHFFDPQLDMQALRWQLASWFLFWNSQIAPTNSEHSNLVNIPDSLESTMKAAFLQSKFTTCPLVLKLFKFLATLPVTSCTCERSISMLGLVKSVLRGRMTNERLDDICLLKCSRARGESIDCEALIDQFMCKNSTRRAKLERRPVCPANGPAAAATATATAP